MKKVFVFPITIAITGDEEFLHKLEVIDDELETYIFGSIEKIKILSNKYNETMKKMNITLKHLTEEELKTYIECIARFENLRQLELEFGHLNITEPIDDCLSLIGQKCNKLLKLDLLCDGESVGSLQNVLT